MRAFSSVQASLLLPLWLPLKGLFLTWMGIRIPSHSVCPSPCHASPVLWYISWLLPHSFLLYLHSILPPKSAYFQTCILSLHDVQTSSMHFFPWDIPWNLIRQTLQRAKTDRETGCWQQTAVCSQRGQHTAYFVVRGFQRGLPLGTRLCLQSVVCYTLCRRCCENEVAAGSGKGIWSSRKTGLWLRVVEPQAQGWFRQQTGRIWKPPFLVPRRTSGQNVPNLWTHSQKANRFFSQNWNGRGSHFRALLSPW